MQFAYRTGGNCTDALISIQHFALKALDETNTAAVRLFSLDFSKAFDSVKHDLLARKLKSWPALNSYIINWYLNFLQDRKQRVITKGTVCDWKTINKGTIQGSVSGPYMFNVFINDLELNDSQNVTLIKYADDSNLLIAMKKDSPDQTAKAIESFLSWCSRNEMKCNPNKCKSLVFKKKTSSVQKESFHNIGEYDQLKILGITFQSDCKFTTHVNEKLKEANSCLYVIRSLRKEGYSQAEIDHLFNALVIPKIAYGISVYGSSPSDLHINRCYKRKYCTILYTTEDILKKSDPNILNNIRSNDKHPLKALLPNKQKVGYKLRHETIARPKFNTERYRNSFSVTISSIV